MRDRLVSRVASAATACAMMTVGLALGTATAPAAVPTLMNYQGYLSTAGSQPASGEHAMTFSLYADSTEGAALWSESYDGVVVTAGVFNVLLGSASPLPANLFDGTSLWLQTAVDGVALQPRQHIVTVAYSFRAAVADSAVNQPWQTVDSATYHLSGNVGVGVANPSEPLQVAGVVHSTTGGFKFPDGTVQSTAAPSLQGATRFVVGSYVGDGAASRQITLGISPVFVFVIGGEGAAQVLGAIMNGHAVEDRGETNQNLNRTSVAYPNADGFVVGTAAGPNGFNYSSSSYYYIAFYQ